MTGSVSPAHPAATVELAEFIASLDMAALPSAVTKRTAQLLLDQFGIALRARHEAALCGPLRSTLVRLGLTAGSARVVGDPDTYTPSAAALFNGCLGHALDFDDTHARGSIHPSAPIVPAALAAAEIAGTDGADLVAGIVAGYETQIRLSIALDPKVHYNRGFHPTATCGTFGAAAAAARIFGASARQVEDALGLAGSQAAGSMQFLVNGAWNKAFHVGHAAMNGFLAASLAMDGFRGATEAVEGRAGFLHAYSDGADASAATAGLGSAWETLQIAVKPYPSCRYGHAAMDALIHLRNEHALETSKIARVRVGLPANGMQLIGEPIESKRQPANYVDGQFSMPFVGAVALREGAMGWDAYARHLDDAQTMALCAKFETHLDPLIEAEMPRYLAGSVEIEMSDGTRHAHTVIAAKGEPENFLSDAELTAKFDALAAPVLDEVQRGELSAAALDIASAPSVGAVLQQTNPDQDLTMVRSVRAVG